MKRPINMLNLQHESWESFIGNAKLKAWLQRLSGLIRQSAMSGLPLNINSRWLIVGPSRSGKTAMVQFFIRCVFCQKFDETSGNPCDGSCETCLDNVNHYGLVGLHAVLQQINSGRSIPVHAIVIDCTRIHTPNQLQDALDSIGETSDGIRIIYCDEVHRLVFKSMDEKLLTKTEQTNAIWMFSTAKPDGLEDMFVKRLLIQRTELPSEIETATWLVDLCKEYTINACPESIRRVVSKSECIPGIALQALALAELNKPDGLTIDLVENNWLTTFG
jgi:hypothetical protein